MRSAWRLLILLGIVLSAGACSEAPEGGAGRPMVVVSVLPQAYFVERIAGDLVEVEVMIPPGASPSTHEPSMSQMRAVSRASLYVKVGHPSFPFERAWLDRIVGEGVAVVDSSAGVDRLEGDPHVWVSPGAAVEMAAAIEGALSELLPSRADELEANLASLLSDIGALDAEIRSMLSAHEGARFFVFHPAWGYFAREYGLVQVAVEHEHKEPSPGHLAGLIEAARASGARVVLVQPQFSRRSAEMVASEVGAEVVAADPLARDWLSNTREVASRLAEALGP